MDPYSTGLASHWDELVGWEERAEREMEFLLGLLEKFTCKNVLDVALGTGFHSIELLKRGVQVTSVDASSSMVAKAHQNAKAHSVELNAFCADWVDLDKVVSQKFDCVLCLGNSLACEMESSKRHQAVDQWSQCLSETGIVIVDRRNYEALLEGKYNFGSKGPYSGKTVDVEPSRIAPDGTVFSYTFGDGKTFRLDMYPLREKHLKELFVNAGLSLTEVYGDRDPSRRGNDVGFYTSVFTKVENAHP